MKGLLGYSLLGLLAFLLSLLVLMPATVITTALSARLSGFSAQTVEGRAADGAMRGVRWRGMRVDRLVWRWQPLTLLGGGLEFGLNADAPEINVATSASVGLDRQLRLRDLNGRLPLARLGALAGQPKLPLQGLVEFNLRELRLNTTGDAAGLPISAEGVVYLRDLRAKLGQTLNLGDFTLSLTPAQPAGVHGVLKDNGGPLTLEGTLNLAPDGRYRFNGQAALREAGNQPLRQAMSLLGPPGGDGRWALGFSGVLVR